jgi:hypothetical protein
MNIWYHVVKLREGNKTPNTQTQHFNIKEETLCHLKTQVLHGEQNS